MWKMPGGTWTFYKDTDDYLKGANGKYCFLCRMQIPKDKLIPLWYPDRWREKPVKIGPTPFDWKATPGDHIGNFCERCLPQAKAMLVIHRQGYVQLDMSKGNINGTQIVESPVKKRVVYDD